MPVISFMYEDFCKLLGSEISLDDLTSRLPMIGADLDKVEGSEISIEFFPNRPDLISVEGVARAARAFFGFELGLKSYAMKPSGMQLIVDDSVKEVRPFIQMAVVRDVQMSDELVKSLMGLQEKLHIGLGRNRKKLAIGVHNIEPVKSPFVYKAVDPDAVGFVPLAKDEYMTMSQILTDHEKGIDYAHLLEDMTKHPLIVDANENVVSYPPIINGSLTEVTPYTSDFLIDVTGIDEEAVRTALCIVATALAERGGLLYSVEVVSGDVKMQTPDLSSSFWRLETAKVNSLLGTSFSDEEVTECLGKMGHDVKASGRGVLEVCVAAWRNDILHEVDLIEDVAVGFGYDCFKPTLPSVATFGSKLSSAPLVGVLRQTLIGLGANEVTTMAISNPQNEFIRLGLEKDAMVSFENPLGEEYSGLRVSMIPSLLRILMQNRHHPLPQMIFEVGVVVDGKSAENKLRLAALRSDAKASFTLCKQYVEAVLRELEVKHSFVEGSHPAFIEGRCARVLINEGRDELAVFGEIHPKTIEEFDLEHPLIGFELDVEVLL